MSDSKTNHDNTSFGEKLNNLLDTINNETAGISERGKVAEYIPELAHVDPEQFGIAVATRSGVFSSGDCDKSFSIQSISKLFTLSLALGLVGDRLWNKVGREPSGNAFNSIMQLELEKGRPRNPFINAGALVVVDTLLSGHQPKEILAQIVQFIRVLADDDSIVIDHHVAKSEKETSYANAALTNYMRAHGVIENPVDKVLGVYVNQCALSMSCRQLAQAASYLAFKGCPTPSSPRIISADQTRRVVSIMATCGLYDASGEFAYRVGLPAKSGVGGGILAIMPGIASMAVWSPGLDTAGNSVIGIKALEQLSLEMGWSVFS